MWRLQAARDVLDVEPVVSAAVFVAGSSSDSVIAYLSQFVTSAVLLHYRDTAASVRARCAQFCMFAHAVEVW